MRKSHATAFTEDHRRQSATGNSNALQGYIDTICSASAKVLESEQKAKVTQLRDENCVEKLIKHTSESQTNADNEQKLFKLYELIEAGLDATPDALLMLDLAGNVRFSNQQFKELFKLSETDELIESRDQFLGHIQQHILESHILENAIKQTLRDSMATIECEFETHDAKYLEAVSKPHIQNEEIVGHVWTFRDMTQNRMKVDDANHQAAHDLLTGLPNKRHLRAKLANILNQAESNQSKTGVLFFDLDGFKDVNESLGHDKGDLLLKQVATRLQALLPHNALLARHGADEFVAVIENTECELDLIERSQTIIKAFDNPFNIQTEELFISVSIGIALSPDHANNAEKLISCADIAMYQAKESGRHTFKIFSESKDAEAHKRLRIRNQINIALEKDEFELFFQPKICLESGSIKGAEALIRWRPDGTNFRSPMEFIPIAEESGQIIPISQWVIQRCCEYIRDWKEMLDDDFVLALNISAKHFVKGQLQQDVADALAIYDIDPSKIELEVTETAIMDDLELAVDTLNELKALGIRTAIDDFGTGHSSLSYLRKLPIEILKIDKSFIDEILTSAEDRTLVKGIIDMVHALGIEVVAEGVENYNMAELLMEMSCDLVQGFHYCKPISEEEFIELIRTGTCYL